MTQSLMSAGVGLAVKGGEFVGSGQTFRLGGAEVSGGFIGQYPGLFSAGSIFIVGEIALQDDDFSLERGGPAVVVMRYGDFQVAVDRGVSIFD